MPSSQKIWFITGTSSGFGEQIVHSALARGDRVIATARSIHKIQHLASSCCYIMQLDVTESFESIEAKAQEALSVWGRVDVLVNNAGFGTVGIIEQAGVQGIVKQYQTNLFGVINVTNAFLPHMRERRTGTVVMIGSRSGWRTNLPLSGLYSSSKAALHAVSETYSAELRYFNVRVLLVEPGGFRTKSFRFTPCSPRWDGEVVLDECMLLPGKSFPDYEPLERMARKFIGNVAGKELGDPKKGVEIIVDVVRGEGVAVGKEWPEWLFLGEDCLRDVRAKIERILKTMDEWHDVSVSTAVQDRS